MEDPMNIAILGTGCPKCKRTTDVVRKAVEEMGVEATIQKIEDIREIMKYRVMMTPAVAIDGQVKISGKVPTVDEVKSLLATGIRVRAIAAKEGLSQGPIRRWSAARDRGLRTPRPGRQQSIPGQRRGI